MYSPSKPGKLTETLESDYSITLKVIALIKFNALLKLRLCTDNIVILGKILHSGS